MHAWAIFRVAFALMSYWNGFTQFYIILITSEIYTK